MLLRASGQREAQNYELGAVNGSGRESGVPHGDHLVQITELTIRGEWDELAIALAAASAKMGRQQAVDALVVAAAFNGITRVADCTGIPLDEDTAATTEDLRASVGLNDFTYQAKSRRYG
jgi:hypothetical protein